MMFMLTARSTIYWSPIFSPFLQKKLDQVLNTKGGGWTSTERLRAMEGIAPNSCTRPVLEKKARPQEQLNCPRCNSTNTKFCYYNNYSLTQPRYFCKTCRRYWTEGGSLRNVPVGGGSRKNKKIISASPSSSPASSKIPVPDLNPPSLSQNPKMQGGHDLNLAFPAMEKYHGMSPYVEMPKIETGDAISSAPSSLSAVELLRSGMAPRGLNPYVHSLMPSSNALYSPGFPMHEIKQNIGFDGLDQNRSSYGIQENGRLLFPFGEMKQLSAGHVEVEQNKEQGSSAGYWTGMIGEGSSW